METIFVLFGSVELSGGLKPAANKDLVVEHYVQLTLDWNKKSAGEKILDAKTKLSKMTGNSDMPTTWPVQFVTLTQLTTNITDADAKLLARSKKEAGSAPKLVTAVKLLHDNCKNLGQLVQIIMDGNNPEAIRICSDAGYTYKISVIRGKRKNEVKQSTEAGVVVVFGEGRGARQWQMSVDGGTTIIELPPTSSGVITVRDLITEKKYWFRCRLVLTKGRYGDWTSWFYGFAP